MTMILSPRDQKVRKQLKQKKPSIFTYEHVLRILLTEMEATGDIDSSLQERIVAMNPDTGNFECWSMDRDEAQSLELDVLPTETYLRRTNNYDIELLKGDDGEIEAVLIELEEASNPLGDLRKAK